MSHRVRIRRLAAVLCLSVIASPALAQSFQVRGVISGDLNRTVQSTWLDYSDLDLTQTQDAQRLLIRIEDAAKTVCHGMHGIDPNDLTKEFRECRETAISSAVASMRNRPLSALAAERRRERLAAR